MAEGQSVSRRLAFLSRVLSDRDGNPIHGEDRRHLEDWLTRIEWAQQVVECWREQAPSSLMP